MIFEVKDLFLQNVWIINVMQILIEILWPRFAEPESDEYLSEEEIPTVSRKRNRPERQVPHPI